MTPIERAQRDVLRFLLSEYLKGPSVLYPINEVAARTKCTALEISDALLEKNLIRERWIYHDGVIACKITIKGIEEIDPMYVQHKLKQVIGGLGESGGSKELLDVLEHRLEEYSITMDIVRQLEVMGLIKILHPQNSIVLELTQEGRRYYEHGSRSVFTLMAY